METLFEREPELAAIDRALDRSARGSGQLLVIEGEPGIGKSELLQATRARASGRGFAVVHADASALEATYAFGVVRTLLEPGLLEAREGRQAPPESDRTARAARLADPVLRPPSTDGGAQPDLGAVIHGLYWTVIRLSADAPLLIAIDDLQWADAASLRFAGYLARRLDGLPVLAAVTVRSGEHGAGGLVSELLVAPQTVRLRPQPLSDGAVAAALSAELGRPVDASFAAGCRRASGGVPFLLGALLQSIVEEGIEPTAQGAAAIEALRPDAVVHSTMDRLLRLGPAATEVARAVAVLGPAASVGMIASLCGVPPDEVALALDALGRAAILRADRPVAFRHPLLATAVYQEIATYRRGQLHHAAARLLDAAGADPEAVASHLLIADGAPSESDVDLLIDAARRAVARAAPESGAAYLRRALEGVGERARRARLYAELGRCEQQSGDPASAEHLRCALDLTVDARERAELSMSLAQSLFLAFDLPGSYGVLRAALDELDLDGGGDVGAPLTLMSAHAGFGDPRLHLQVRADLPRIRRLANGEGQAARELRLFLGMVAAVGAEPRPAALRTLLAGLTGEPLGGIDSAASTSAVVAVTSLVLLDKLDRAEELATAMLADARRTGIATSFVAASAHLGLVALRRGELARAEAETRAALEVAEQHQLHFTIPFTLTYLGETLLERGGAAEARELVERPLLPPGFEQTLAGAMLRVVRGRLRAATGDRAIALTDLDAGGQALLALGIRSPACGPWRSELALALPAVEADRATALAADELADARRSGVSRSIGVALRARGLLERGDRSIALLEEAVTELESTPARLERARALVDLGATRRRANARVEAREPLRRGLDLAVRCGAGALSARARDELVASGGRPRRPHTSGLEALTASELRVAQLASRGDSNREIAHALFITPKTVENHLGSVYRKLGFGDRSRLAELPLSPAVEDAISP
jgi:DNA-binding CsgD family transcriptional regulator